MSTTTEMHGGILIGEVLAKQGVRFLYTLCGGHISPILVGAQAQGIRVIDTRHEATALFAADATARLTGVPGVAAVTAGPGLTNTITALKNAQMAQSPVVVLGGAAATLLKGRGALQDIDHMSLVKPLVKWSKAVSKVRDIVPALEKAFHIAQAGVPGPVYLELPIDLLYQEAFIRQWTMETAGGKGLAGRAVDLYLRNHLRQTFSQAWDRRAAEAKSPQPFTFRHKEIERVHTVLQQAERPVLVVGSQALLNTSKAHELRRAVNTLGIPTYLSGMARGLLGYDELHMRHKRTKALREADVVLLAGVPCDFRMGYGRVIPGSATYISINRSKTDLTKNRKPDIGILGDPGAFLCFLGAGWVPSAGVDRLTTWRTSLQSRNDERDAEIVQMAQQETEFVNPVQLCQQLEQVIDKDSVIIGDGGDFVATASYILRPRAPLSWLDPGPFGTLGTGGGFALAAQLCRPTAEVWLLYGDGSAGYSLAEFDSYARHGLPVIAVVGNDASWAQIAREQVEMLGTSLGTDLARTTYDKVAEGYGGVGLSVESPENVESTLMRAKELAREGKPVLVNVMIGKTEFRKGSISV